MSPCRPRFRVKKDKVGVKTRANKAALVKLEFLCRKPGHFVDGLGEWEKFSSRRVAAEDAGKGSP